MLSAMGVSGSEGADPAGRYRGSRAPTPGSAGSCGFTARSSPDASCSPAHCLPLWSRPLGRSCPPQTSLGQEMAWNSHAGCLEKEKAQESVAQPCSGVCQTPRCCCAEGQRCQDQRGMLSRGPRRARTPASRFLRRAACRWKRLCGAELRGSSLPAELGSGPCPIGVCRAAAAPPLPPSLPASSGGSGGARSLPSAHVNLESRCRSARRHPGPPSPSFDSSLARWLRHTHLTLQRAPARAAAGAGRGVTGSHGLAGAAAGSP